MLWSKRKTAITCPFYFYSIFLFLVYPPLALPSVCDYPAFYSNWSSGTLPSWQQVNCTYLLSTASVISYRNGMSNRKLISGQYLFDLCSLSCTYTSFFECNYLMTQSGQASVYLACNVRLLFVVPQL